jgi:hypothetical protein
MLTPTPDHLCRVESEIAEIHNALLMINNRSDTVASGKQDVSDALQMLTNRVTELCITIPNMRGSPVKYNSSKSNFLHLYRHLKSNTGHHYELPINQCTPAAQVSVFLGVICSVMMGIS